MNDQQLIDALRAIDRPVAPDRDFAESLWRQLPKPTARPAVRWELLLAAALLAAAAVGVALIAGARLLQPTLVVDAPPGPVPTLPTQPTPEPTPASTPRFAVVIPDGVSVSSTVDEVEAVAIEITGAEFGLEGGVQRIEAMTVLVPGTLAPDLEGLETATVEPMWAVDVVNALEQHVILYVADGSLEVGGVELPPAEPDPEATFLVLPTWDPARPLELVSDTGRRIRPDVLPIPSDMLLPTANSPVAAGGYLWSLVWSPYTEDPAYLARVDPTANDIATIPLEGDLRFGTLIAGVDGLWAASGTELRALDPRTGAHVRTIAGREDGSVIGEDAEGLWLRVLDGAALIDPATGAELRQVSFRETGEHPYRGIWSPPAFGSLWDVDRGTGIVHRLDRVTGASVATIDLRTSPSDACVDPRPLTGLSGVPAVIMVDCGDQAILIDPATNTVIRNIADADLGIVIDGHWWVPRVTAPEALGWRWPGALARIDPVSGEELSILTLSREHTAAWAPVVVGDSLWMLVGETAGQGQWYDHNIAFLRIPLSELVPAT